MEYTIVSGETIEALLLIVNQSLSEGWRLYGSPFTVDMRLWAEKPKGAKGSLVCQALVKNVGDGIG